MQDASPNKFLQQLQILVHHEIEFIVVGGVAAVFEGAPIITLDLDIVYDPSPTNNERLAAALRELNAIYRDPAGRRIVPDRPKLDKMKRHLLLTDLGGLDVLTTIGQDRTYQDLIGRSSKYEVAGMHLQVLNLEAIIESKAFANREKDRAVLPILNRTLELKKTSSS